MDITFGNSCIAKVGIRLPDGATIPIELFKEFWKESGKWWSDFYKKDNELDAIHELIKDSDIGILVDCQYASVFIKK